MPPSAAANPPVCAKCGQPLIMPSRNGGRGLWARTGGLETYRGLDGKIVAVWACRCGQRHNLPPWLAEGLDALFRRLTQEPAGITRAVMPQAKYEPEGN